MNTENRKILIWGAIGGTMLTALIYSRFEASPMVLLLFPPMFALATMLAEGVVTFKAGAGWGQRAGLGVGGWWCLAWAAFAFFLSLVR